MKLVVNGEDRTAPDGATVAVLLAEMRLDKAPCAVELNKRVVPKAAHGEQRLSEGDRVEIVTLVGGG